MKDLYVYMVGEVRSPIAAEESKKLAQECGILGYEAQSCGVDSIPSVECSSYDRIFALDEKVEYLLKMYKISAINLDIPTNHKLTELMRRNIRDKLMLHFREFVKTK